jgi:hypothetical protein
MPLGGRAAGTAGSLPSRPPEVTMRTLSREQAIEGLRKKLLELADGDHSMCRIASERKLFCKGFSQWKVADLEERYSWLLQNRPRMTRRQLEDLADRWQLARQFVRDTELSCDTQLEHNERQICGGWGHFTDSDLARFFEEICGEAIELVPKPVDPAPEPPH